MNAFFETWAPCIACASLVLACGSSDNPTNPGSGGSGGTSGMPDAAGPAASTTGPGTTTVVGAGGSGGTGAGGGGGAGGGAGGPGFDAIALFNSQIPASQDRKAWLDTGEQLQPTTLVVAVSTTELSCAAPRFDFALGGTSHAILIVGLPDAMQKVGKYDLASTDVVAWGGSWLSDGTGNGGGGSRPLVKGTVEVLSIDAASVKVQFADLESGVSALQPARTAMRCP